MISQADLIALGVTFKLALVTTLLLFVIGLPLAWWLARSNWRYKFLLEALVAMPLVLPPTVLGFYLLLALGPHGFIGGLLATFNLQPLAFSFSGLVVGSMVYSLPFVVQPLTNAFASISTRQLEVAATLGAPPLDQIASIALPQARAGLITAAVLGFAHTIGEFGVVLMIGGNIPGETQVLSITIYEHVESLQYAQAHWLSAGLLVLSFVMLVAVYAFNRQFRMRVI
ncbi:MAG: molybdate ABC transporter permease subunit [Acidiferrobacterales bacterium]|nr:molybdate ABC transporter permease subunit [Acidiferrobacterales bacterium]